MLSFSTLSPVGVFSSQKSVIARYVMDVNRSYLFFNETIIIRDNNSLFVGHTKMRIMREAKVGYLSI